ncbi:MAG: beta-N-acetylhexosaminidase [Prolixibacteraceae bacterium]
MKLTRQFVFFSLFIIVLASCQKEPPVPMDLGKSNLIPQPVSLMATNSSFALSEKTTIYVQGQSPEVIFTAHYMAKLFQPSTGFPLKVKAAPEKITKGNIVLAINPNIQVPNKEGYQLSISENQVLLEALEPVGIIRGIQTIRQLLPAEIELKSKQKGPWLLASGTIVDYPEYEYRGAMLDVSRHFFGVDVVKSFIDYMVYYKLNALHLHLADDQGWRIEIKSWPNLTKIGGQTQVGGGKGGFYTQEEFKELVKYAGDRYITIVPEIDMPGHTNAALASYAELNCDGIARELYTGTKVGFSSLCTDKEITYRFIDDVVSEISEMNPGPFMHIGGDESHVTLLKDYIPFINKVQKIVHAHGKKVIGWDEIAHANMDSTSIVQFWDNAKNARMGISKGTKVIVSPAKRAYLDMKYDSTTKLGLNWAAYIEVDQAYNWDPANYAEGLNRENIFGIESPLWSETVTNLDEIEFLVFPRLAAHAEIGWSVPDKRNWDDFSQRLGHQAGHLNALGIDFYRSPKVPWTTEIDTINVN